MTEKSLASIEKHAREIGKILLDVLPPGVGFTLWLFDFGEGGWFTFLSNTRRDDMIRVFIEHIDKLMQDPKTSDESRKAVQQWKSGRA